MMAAAKKATSSTKKPRIPRTAFKKDEGPLQSADTSSKMDVIRALNWASMHRELKELAEFSPKYLTKVGFTKDEIRDILRNEVGFTATDHALCRLGVLGDLPHDIARGLYDRSRAALATSRGAAEPADRRPSNVINLPRSVTVVRELIGELEGCIDNVLKGELPAIPSPYVFLQEQKLTAAQINTIASWIDSAITAHESIEDPEVAKYYSLTFKRKYKAISKYLNLIQSDVDTLRNNVRRTRKKRKVSSATVSRRVEKSINTTLNNLKYQTEDDETRLQSLNPSKVFGADTVVLYNPDKRVLTLLRAAEGQTLSIKKQSVQGVDPAQSVSCKVRTPARHVPQVAAATRMEAVRIITSVIKTTKRAASARITPSSMIIAAYASN